MKVENFIVALGNYYESEYSQEMINRINKWMGNAGIQEQSLDKIFDTVTINFKPYSYKKKPDLKDIVDSYTAESFDNDNLNEQFVMQRERITKMDVREIVKLLKRIRIKQDNEELTPLEIDALHDWDDMRIECNAMAEHGMDGDEIRVHMENIKEAIIGNKKFNSVFNRIKTNALTLKEVREGMHKMEDVL